MTIGSSSSSNNQQHLYDIRHIDDVLATILHIACSLVPRRTAVTHKAPTYNT
jgi:hypothetical protein